MGFHVSLSNVLDLLSWHWDIESQSLSRRLIMTLKHHQMRFFSSCRLRLDEQEQKQRLVQKVSKVLSKVERFDHKICSVGQPFELVTRIIGLKKGKWNILLNLNDLLPNLFENRLHYSLRLQQILVRLYRLLELDEHEYQPKVRHHLHHDDARVPKIEKGEHILHCRVHLERKPKRSVQVRNNENIYKAKLTNSTCLKNLH